MKKIKTTVPPRQSTIIAVGEGCNVRIFPGASMLHYSFAPITDLKDSVVLPNGAFFLPEGETLYGFINDDYGDNIEVTYFKKM